jgi:hypothetical protein
MVTKNKNREEKAGTKATTKSRIKVGKLNLNKETIKDLTPDNKKGLKGGMAWPSGPDCGGLDGQCTARHSTCI